MAGKSLGVATVSVNGRILRSKPGAKHAIGGYSRNEVKGARSIDVGFSEEATPSTTECDLIHDGTVSLAEMRGWDNVTITFETDIGKTYITRGAWLVDPPMTSSGQNGSVPLKFMGPPSEEVT